MMVQYHAIKAEHPDALLFYRMGDFYELFFADAEVAARTLGIVLTKRGQHEGADIPMCGVPVVRSDDYLHRLIAAGHRVAICEQTEDPAEAKKRGAKSVVARAVIRLVTPGTLTEETLLEPARANWLLALARTRADATKGEASAFGLAAVDISTGAFEVCDVPGIALGGEIGRIDPREIVVPDALADSAEVKRALAEVRIPVTRIGREPGSAERRLLDYSAWRRSKVSAACRRRDRRGGDGGFYLERTQCGARPKLEPPLSTRRATRWRSTPRRALISS